MTVAALIQKGGLAPAATPATSATQAPDRAGTVATLATVAVANPAGARYRWRVTLADGTPFEVCCLPELTAAEMRELYPGTTLAPLPGAPEQVLLGHTDRQMRPAND